MLKCISCVITQLTVEHVPAQELDEAIDCFSKAQELGDSDPAIPRELAKAKQARTAAEKKQRATYTKMFG